MKTLNTRAKVLTVLCLCLLATGCSSAQKSGADEAEASVMEGGSESSADAVGSIPEDMLAEEKGGEGHAEGAPADASNDAFNLLADDQAAAAPAGEVAEASTDAGAEQMTMTETTAPSGETGWYEVKRGDTLMKVAFSIYGDIDRWKDLRDWNADSLHGKQALHAGAKLKYETPAEAFSPQELSHSYLIKNGDTLAGIADDVYGRRAKYKKLQSYNARLIKNPNRIFAGFSLYYEITEQEIGEAEARRQQKAASLPKQVVSEAAPVPSAVNPPALANKPAPASVAAAKFAPAAAPKGAAKPGVPDLAQEEPVTGPTPASK